METRKIIKISQYFCKKCEENTAHEVYHVIVDGKVVRIECDCIKCLSTNYIEKL